MYIKYISYAKCNLHFTERISTARAFSVRYVYKGYICPTGASDCMCYSQINENLIKATFN